MPKEKPPINPAEATKFYDQGTVYLENNELENAIQSFKQALYHYPDYFFARADLELAQQKKNRPRKKRNCGFIKKTNL